MSETETAGAGPPLEHDSTVHRCPCEQCDYMRGILRTALATVAICQGTRHLFKAALEKQTEVTVLSKALCNAETCLLDVMGALDVLLRLVGGELTQDDNKIALVTGELDGELERIVAQAALLQTESLDAAAGETVKP